MASSQLELNKIVPAVKSARVGWFSWFTDVSEECNLRFGDPSAFPFSSALLGRQGAPMAGT